MHLVQAGQGGRCDRYIGYMGESAAAIASSTRISTLQEELKNVARELVEAGST